MTFVTVFLKSVTGTRQHVISYRIHSSNGKQCAIINTPFSISPQEWSQPMQSIKKTADSHRSLYLRCLQNRISADVSFIDKFIGRFYTNNYAPLTKEYITEAYRSHCHHDTFYEFTSSIIDKLRRNNQLRTAETYRSALNSFLKFLESFPCIRLVSGNDHDNDILLNCIDDEIIEAYQLYLHEKKLRLNTISFYMRILRAIYNRASDEGLTLSYNPFRGVYTGIEKTIKRALTIREIRRIQSIDLKNRPSLQYARDIFILSLYMQGMSMVDMSYLKTDDCVNGYITYQRSKTGSPVFIKWTTEMEQIARRYRHEDSPYLLPILNASDDKTSSRKQYLKKSYQINIALKRVARLANISSNLTLYCARHSWASIALKQGIPLSVISQGMGHESEKTTRIYLASLDHSLVDKANRKIINLFSNNRQR